MEQVVKIELEKLNRDNVNVKKQTYIKSGDLEYPFQEPWRKNYINSTRGREEIKAELSEPYLSVVMLMWGDAPTIIEETVSA